MGFTRRTSVPHFGMLPRPRRRSTAGIAFGVFLAILTAIFASRVPQPAQVLPSARRAPSAAATSTGGRATSTARESQSERRTPSSSSPGFTSRRSLEEHFEKHGEQFPGLSVATYLAAAQTLRDAPDGGDVLELRRRDGVVTRFDRATGAFLAVNRDGTIRTFFKPNDGEAYFRRQASRTPGGGP